MLPGTKSSEAPSSLKTQNGRLGHSSRKLIQLRTNAPVLGPPISTTAITGMIASCCSAVWAWTMLGAAARQSSASCSIHFRSNMVICMLVLIFEVAKGIHTRDYEAFSGRLCLQAASIFATSTPHWLPLRLPFRRQYALVLAMNNISKLICAKSKACFALFGRRIC